MLGAWLVLPDANRRLGLRRQPVRRDPRHVRCRCPLSARINGFLVVRLRLNAFIVTLAMLILLRGMHARPHQRQDPLRPARPDGLSRHGQVARRCRSRSGSRPCSTSLVGLFLRYHRSGRAIYAIGGNARGRARRRHPGRPGHLVAALHHRRPARRARGPDARPAGSPRSRSSQGQNMIFYVFAAAVIGGISLDGGRGPSSAR